MVGGLVTSFALELLVYPAIYYLWKKKGLAEGPASAEPELAAPEAQLQPSAVG
jgi:Cu(I)/Ag(I) efflux system membrane protein CusA/SilA